MGRYDRQSGKPDSEVYRSAGLRDRDRVLYTSALRRLSGVTQVASAAEGTIFHNRLTHTLEVGQVGRSIAIVLLRRDGSQPGGPERIAALGGLDPDVVAAAALAHDLGHPPYGHVGEEVLDDAVRKASEKDCDGFEGNAQSFRIVTRLALRDSKTDGLNLTRATLNAILKYPWLWSERPGDKPKKWGAYESEKDAFDWARQEWTGVRQAQSLEAAVMDWADDITYAIHDLEDFYRAGLIPLDILTRFDGNHPLAEKERQRFTDSILRREKDWKPTKEETENCAERVFLRIGEHGIDSRYDGSPLLRRHLRRFTSAMIGRYVEKGSTLGDTRRTLRIYDDCRMEVDVLKQLTWHYVIHGPALATQQMGQRRVIKELFRLAYDVIKGRRWWVLPSGFQGTIEEAYNDGPVPEEKALAARLAADFIAGLTEAQVIRLHRRTTGVEMGRLLGPMD